MTQILLLLCTCAAPIPVPIPPDPFDTPDLKCLGFSLEFFGWQNNDGTWTGQSNVIQNVKGYQALKAGIHEYDVLTKIGYDNVNWNYEVARCLRHYRRGALVTIEVLRDQKPLTLYLKIK